ncbi:MAG: hypothetical protein RIC15_12035 [Vicingaceae bacterium]
MAQINLGMTYRHTFIAIILIVLGGLSFFLHWILSLLLMALAVLFFTAKSVFEVDGINMRFRKSDVFLHKKFGIWRVFSAEDKVLLTRTREAQTMNSRGTSVTSNVKTFDVLLDSSQGRIELHEFGNYQNAKELYNLFTMDCKLQGIDLLELQQKKQ